MAQLIIDNFLGGISPSDRLGKEGSYFIGENADPTREIGYLEPGFSQTNVAKSDDDPAVITNYVNSITIDSVNQKVYYIEHSPEIQRSTWAIALEDDDPGNYPHTIGDDLTGHADHTTFVGEDVVIYPIGTTHYLFYSWNDNTDGDVGKVALVGDDPTFEDDNLSNTVASGAVLRKTVPHPMLPWQENGMLYIGNGKDLVEIDGQTGANGTADMTSFSLPEGWVITCLFPAGDLIGIGAMYMPGTFSFSGVFSRAAVFFWDGALPKWVRKIWLPDPEIRAAINLNGDYYVFTKNVQKRGLLRKWDGNGFKLEQTLRNNSDNSFGVPQSFGCVANYNNCILFSNGKRVSLYGSPEPGLPKGFYNIAEAEGDGTDQTCYAVAVSNAILVLSSYDASETKYYLTKFNTGYESEFLWTSLYYEFPKKIRINYVRLYFKTLASGADDDIKIETNYGDTTTTLGSISYAVEGAKEYKRFNVIGKACQTCHNFRVIIDTDEANSTTAVRYGKIVVDWDYVGDDD